MKIRRKIAGILMIFTVVLSSFATLPILKAASYDVYSVKFKCPVRVSPDENAGKLMSGNDPINVAVDQQLEYISTATGSNNGKPNQTWYAVKFDYAAREYAGYVAATCITKQSYSYNDDSTFESSIHSFPESYKPYLRKLHAIHPNWKFKPDYTNLNWKKSVNAQSQKGTSAISFQYPSLKFTDVTYPNGIVVDGSSWYAPCWDAVAYYMDARNFLNEKNIFMFETLSYNSTQDSSVSGILSGGFMGGNFTENGTTRSYADAFIEAARNTNVSSIHLASRALQEMGTTMGPAASGTTPGYEGYYNFYNIGAYSGTDNYLKGLQYAKDAGWNGVQKSITGGAGEIGGRYINKGQDTIYFQKYNTASYRKLTAHTHQYMTNIMAPTSEASSIYKTYKDNGKLNNNYTFTIPVYDLMPDTAYKVSRTDTVGGDEDIPGEGEPGDNNPGPPVVSPETKLSNAGYSLATGYVTALRRGSDVSEVRNNLVNAGASAAIMNSGWGSKPSGLIATGDIINVDTKNFTAVIYGDIAGDGNISIKDLLLVQKYLLGSQNLSGANKVAADVSKDGAVTIKDLLLIQKYLLGTGSIDQ